MRASELYEKLKGEIDKEKSICARVSLIFALMEGCI